MYTISFDTGTSGWKIEPITRAGNSVIDLDEYFSHCYMNYMVIDPDYDLEGVYEQSDYTHKTSLGIESYNGTEETDYSSYTITESKTFYVKMLARHIVTFYAHGGKFSDDTESKEIKIMTGKTINDAVDNLLQYLTISKEGATFLQWTNDAEGNASADLTTTVTEDISLYAQWTESDSGLLGYWTYTTTSDDTTSNYAVYFGDSGTGVFFGREICAMTYTTAAISYGPKDDLSYTYSGGVLKIDDYTCSRPTETKTDGTVTVGTLKGTLDCFTGKWSCDDTNIYILTNDSYVLSSYKRSNLYIGSTVDLGGYYYNYAGTAEYNNQDPYAMYLDTDGSYTIWLWNQEIKGTWFTARGGDLFMTGDYTRGWHHTPYTMNGGTLEFKDPDNNKGSDDILTCSSEKGSVVEYSEDTNLTGTWSGTTDYGNVTFIFTSDGIYTYQMLLEGQLYSPVSYFVAKNGCVYSRERDLENFFANETEYMPYVITGNSITFNDNYILTKQ